MYYKLFILISFFSFQSLWSQTLPLIEKTVLNSSISETSGLIFWDNKTITHNDSGGQNALFELDTATGEIIRTVFIENAINNDWEDITQDENFIYIGDFGNNSGNRTNLSILKISKVDYESSINDTISSEKISFNYGNQTSFNSTQFQTNFDAEAIISIDNQLVIFSKNWGDNKTRVYQLPKEIGDYTLLPSDSFDINGLVTASFFQEEENKLYLITYEYLYIFENVTLSNIFGDTNKRYGLEFQGSTQVEAICGTSENNFLLSTEAFLNQPAKLYEFELQNVVNSIKIDENDFSIFPNPVAKLLTVYSEIHKISSIEIINSSGKLINTIENRNDKEVVINMPKENDVYFLKVTTKKNAVIYKKIIVK